MNSPTSSTEDSLEALRRANYPGDPNCPICHGIGFLRRDVPLGDPDFGRMFICSCRQSEVSNDIRQRLYRLSNLDALKALTFETFQPRGLPGLGPQQADSLERAYNHSRQFASNLEGWLLLMGGYGCGKTHLAAAVANFAVSLGVPTLFLTVPDLLDWMRFAYESSETNFEDRFDEIRNVRLLVLDDFGTQNATPWAQEKLFQIFNYRYTNHLPLVVTTNLSLDDIEGRIQSRLQDPQLVTRVFIQAPDYRNPSEDTNHPQLSSLHLHAARTFATFSLRRGEGLPAASQKSLENAYNAAQAFADKPRGWIVFYGTYGCGKTHLAAAIANYRAGLGDPPLFVVAPDLLDHLRATFNPNSSTSYDRRFDEVRTSSLLVLDDLGTQSTTPWAREKLFQLFNYRYNAELATVITTATPLDELDPRIRSRMADTRLCTIYGIDVSAYRPAATREEKPRSRGRSPRTS